MNKNAVISLLVGLNLLLVAGLAVYLAEPKAAHAQFGGGAARFLVNTVRIRSDLDALCLVELQTRKMLCFEPDRNARRPLEAFDEVEVPTLLRGE